MKNKLFVLCCCLTVFFFGITTSSAQGGGEPDITMEYQRLSSLYENNFIKGDYSGAFKYAKEQLEIDPSDIVAYIRLAVAAQYIDVDKEKLKRHYAPFISEKDDLHKEVKSLANSFLSSKKKKTDR